MPSREVCNWLSVPPMFDKATMLVDHFLWTMQVQGSPLCAFVRGLDEARLDPWVRSLATQDLISPLRDREAPKAMAYLQPRFEAKGWSWPVDLTGAISSPSFWQLPEGSFVQLAGATRRALLVLIDSLILEGGFQDIPHGSIGFVNMEMSSRFARVHVDSIGTLVPKMRMVVIDRRQFCVRMSWLMPCEAFDLMGAPLHEVLPLTELADLPSRFSYYELILVAGQAFHVHSALAFIIATLMLCGCKRHPRVDAPSS